MSKHIADAGIAACGILILINGMTEMKPGFMASALFVVGCLFIGGAATVWRSQKSIAQTAQNGTIINNSGGGIGADISVQGTPGSATPNVGLETNGLTVIQNGPGTGLKIEVGGSGGPAIGVRSTVTVPPR